MLNKLQPGTEVDVFLSGGKVLEDVIFLRLSNRTCCATFRDEEQEQGTTLFVDCRDIVALRIE
nr:penicillin-binding protein [Mesobacillus jeotgali]